MTRDEYIKHSENALLNAEQAAGNPDETVTHSWIAVADRWLEMWRVTQAGGTHR